MSQPLTPPPSQPSIDQPAYPGSVPPPAPQQQQQQGTSGLAIAGLILAVLPLIGFILSLVAIFQTGPGKKRGRGLAITGLILSVVIGVVYSILSASLLNNVATVADPGCTSGKAAIIAMGSNPTPDSIDKTIADLNAAAAKAKDDEVRSAMKTLADDYAKLMSDAKAGKAPGDAELKKIEADGAEIDRLCTIGS